MRWFERRPAMERTSANILTAASPANLKGSRLRLLEEILGHRDDGRTVEELSEALGITRNAVQQHLGALERDGLVAVLGLRNTGGRPGRAYALTEAGQELFPRSYALLAESLLRHSRDLFGEEGLNALLDSMAAEVAAGVEPRLAGKTGEERRTVVVDILNELGYGASLNDDGAIQAVNCVFHNVARSDHAACRFDLTLLSALLAGEVTHQSCMADGGSCCLFATE